RVRARQKTPSSERDTCCRLQCSRRNASNSESEVGSPSFLASTSLATAIAPAPRRVREPVPPRVSQRRRLSRRMAWTGWSSDEEVNLIDDQLWFEAAVTFAAGCPMA